MTSRLRRERVIAARGFAALFFSIGVLCWGDTAASLLVVLYGVYALVDGALAIVSAGHSRAVVVEGVAGVAFGDFALFWPGMPMVVLLYFIGVWAIVKGLLELVAILRLRNEGRGGAFSQALAGAASLALGLMLLVWADRSRALLIILLGSYALLFGVAMLALRWRLGRKMTRLRFFDGRHGSKHRHA